MRLGLFSALCMGMASMFCLASWAQTPGDVQESLQRRPALPTRPADLPRTEPAPAAPSLIPAGGKQIPIERFEIAGNEVVSTEVLRAIVAPYEGKSLTLFEIYEVADALTSYYREQGYTVASVSVPAQKVSSGTVRFEVIEGRIGEISVAGNDHYKAWLLQKFLGGIKSGDVIQSEQLEQELLLLNDLPGLTARAVVAPGDEYGQSNLVLRAEEDFVEYAARVNNYGRTSIGEWRAEADLSLNAPLGWGDRVDFNGVWAEGNNLNYLSARYSIPVSFRGTRASLYYSSYNYEVNSADLPLGSQSLDISGDGDNFGVTLTHPLIRSRRQNLFIGGGFDRAITRQLTRGLGLKQKADIGLLTLSALYSLEHADSSFTSVSAVFSTNFASNDRNAATHPTKPGAAENNAQPAKLRIDASHYHPFGPLWAAQVRATLVGSLDPLVDTERFRIGGRENVRAFASSELAGDGGYATSLEIFRNFQITSYVPARVSAFFDTGTVTRKNPATVGQETSESLTGTGVAFAAYYTEHYKMDLEMVVPLGSQKAVDGRDDVRVWAGFSADF